MTREFSTILAEFKNLLRDVHNNTVKEFKTKDLNENADIEKLLTTMFKMKCELAFMINRLNMIEVKNTVFNDPIDNTTGLQSQYPSCLPSRAPSPPMSTREVDNDVETKELHEIKVYKNFIINNSFDCVHNKCKSRCLFQQQVPKDSFDKIDLMLRSNGWTFSHSLGPKKSKQGWATSIVNFEIFNKLSYEDLLEKMEGQE